MLCPPLGLHCFFHTTDFEVRSVTELLRLPHRGCSPSPHCPYPHPAQPHTARIFLLGMASKRQEWSHYKAPSPKAESGV